MCLIVKRCRSRLCRRRYKFLWLIDWSIDWSFSRPTFWPSSSWQHVTQTKACQCLFRCRQWLGLLTLILCVVVDSQLKAYVVMHVFHVFIKVKTRFFRLFYSKVKVSTPVPLARQLWPPNKKWLLELRHPPMNVDNLLAFCRTCGSINAKYQDEDGDPNRQKMPQ